MLASKNNKNFDVISTSTLTASYYESQETEHLDLRDESSKIKNGLQRRRQIHRVPPLLRRRNNRRSDYCDVISTSTLTASYYESQETEHLDLRDESSKIKNGLQRRRQIHRVPPLLRRRNNRRSDYDPTIVSLGPYHHGQPELRAAEEVKHRFLDRLASGSHAIKNSLYDTVAEKIDEIRACYADDDCVENYDDGKLATMILLDACFIVAFMEGLAGERDIFSDWHQCLGAALLSFAMTDMLLLENQLPFHVIKRIVALRRGKEGEELIQKFQNRLLSADFSPNTTHISPDGGGDEPLHLLEACHTMLVADIGNNNASTTTITSFKLTKQEGYLMDLTARSATDLRARGVRFKPSSSCSIRDIKFEAGRFSGELQLPVRMVWSSSLVALSNLTAYEMSPGGATGFEVLSYTNLLKSLIEKAEDVKELQEKGILINRFQNHQQLVDELKGVATFGIDNFDIFKDVRLQIEEHCRSRPKNWVADLMLTRFRSPWTVTCFCRLQGDQKTARL